MDHDENSDTEQYEQYCFSDPIWTRSLEASIGRRSLCETRNIIAYVDLTTIVLGSIFLCAIGTGKSQFGHSLPFSIHPLVITAWSLRKQPALSYLRFRYGHPTSFHWSCRMSVTGGSVPLRYRSSISTYSGLLLVYL